ncbi:MAG: DNA polymerase III subunit delta [Bacteroidota bacterium]|jgi:DNA polymerase-3 subunit delta|nr:DNA polymerase III subunit delta [Bacteroidales bacterium]MDI9534586.1 DNA polymerase III subunit delta [Bacteroidota bacterium]OQC43879.1 MAG: DNA polymerase III subunit delta [Bacteroidetes bacterium ADurb.Bin028]NLP20122.1 DNA polymerase III subunit delta [Bacteroidales bacterium]HNY45176.1 DNA polymerase III subunit delta [Bacteroidales bacterium]
MDFEQILADLKNKIYKPIYLFYGEESFFIDELTNYIQQNVLTETEKAFNQDIVYGKDITATNLIELSRAFPMMANYRVVILKEAQGLKDFKNLEPYVQNPVNSTILVLSFKNTAKVDKRLKVFNLLSKNAVVFESKRLYENQVYPWIEKTLRENGLSIHTEALRLFYESIGADLSRLSNEIKKLVITQEKGKQISKEDIAFNIGINRDYNIFELQKAIGLKDKLKCYQILDYFSKDPRANPLFATVNRLFDYFTKIIKLHMLQDKSKQSVANAAGVHPYFAEEYLIAMKNYPMSKLIQIVSYLRETDMKLKGVGAVSISDADLSKELLYKILH